MIREIISLHKQCCGCGACIQACSRSCIIMDVDVEGFSYPKINCSTCIDCHVCETVCPILSKKQKSDSEIKKISTAYAAYSTDETIRLMSSSGGIFTHLAEHIIEQGGAVFGASFSKDLKSVNHILVEDTESLSKLRGSKYLQSNINNTYKMTKLILNSGRMVLYSGTPCQIAGLFGYLRKEYENLYTLSVICHGVPSPKLWRSYVEYREKLAKGKAQRINFRDKTSGWSEFNIRFYISNQNEYRETHNFDPYMQCFLNNWCLRPSCYSCNFKGVYQKADITLGDFWGIDNIAPEMNDDKGTSLVICHSERGNQLLNSISNKLNIKKVDINDSLKYNLAMTESPNLPLERNHLGRYLTLYKFNDFIKKIRKKRIRFEYLKILKNFIFR